jgi:hypothetical protein
MFQNRRDVEIMGVLGDLGDHWGGFKSGVNVGYWEINY